MKDLRPRTRRHVALAGACLALTATAGIVLANPHFDVGYTGKELQWACNDLALGDNGANAAPDFEATCTTNTETKAVFIDLGVGIGRNANGLFWSNTDDHEKSCYDWELEARSDGVYFRGWCAAWATNTATEAWTPWLNLNDGIEWDAEDGVLEWG